MPVGADLRKLTNSRASPSPEPKDPNLRSPSCPVSVEYLPAGQLPHLHKQPSCSVLLV